MKALRVVLLMPTFYPDSFGGAERQAAIMAEALHRMGVDVTILTPTQTPGSAGVDRQPWAEIVRFAVAHPPNLGGRHMGSLLGWTWQALRWLRANRARIDVVHIVHLRLHALPGLLGGRLLGIPVFAKLGRGGERSDFRSLLTKRGGYGRPVYAMAKQFVSRFVANSAEIADDLRQHGIAAERIVHIVNGVEIPPTRSAPPAPRTFVFAGRLDHEKGLFRLLEAVRTLRDDGVRILVRVVGDGPLQSELAAYVAAHGLADSIRLEGFRAEPEAIYGDAGFFVLPSDSEGMSNAMLEAMSRGLVPICSHVSGAGEVIEDGRSGFLIEPGDPSALPDALRRAAALDAAAVTAMGARARRKMEEDHAIDVIAARHVALYRSLLG